MSINSTGFVTDTNLQQQRSKELKKACQEFESVFTYELLKSMRATIDKCDLFHGGEGEEIYESMLDQELAKSMAGYGGNSLSELLYRQLSRIDANTTAGRAANSETDSTSKSSDSEYTQIKTYSLPVQAVSRGTDSEATVSSTGDSRVDSGSDVPSVKDIQTNSKSTVLSTADAQTDSEFNAASKTESQPGWPLKSVISSKFGLRKDPFTSADRFHSGIDIAAAQGTAVKAAMSGKVIMSRNMEGYGNVVALDNGQGIVTIYAHNEKNMVKVGDKVEKGSTIAKVGSTGRSTGPHLHFEVRKDGTKINPVDFLGVA